MRRRVLTLLALLLPACAAPPPSVPVSVPAPEVGDTLAVQPLGPAFGDARAVAADPTGRLYVVDAAEDAVVELMPDGLPLGTLGGPGSGEYAFLSPSDLDPTNGLTLYVADTGNGRIQQFSRERRLLATLPVPADDPETAGRAGRDGLEAGRDGRARTGDGRPVAVASAVTGEVYAVEELRGVVLRWDDRQRLSRVLGRAEMGAGALAAPVDVAVGPDGTVYVADARQAAVLVYDPFGSYVRRIADGTAPALRAVTVHRDRLLLVLADRVLVYTREGRLVRVLAAGLDAPFVDAAARDDVLYLLTSGRLYAADFPR